MDVLSLGLALLVAKVAETLARYASLPPLLGPLVAGALLGHFIDLKVVKPFAKVGALLLIFSAGEDLAERKVNSKDIIEGLIILVVPLVVGLLFLPPQAAVIAALPGVGILVKVSRFEPRLAELIAPLAVAEVCGILVFSGLLGGTTELLVATLVTALALKAGEMVIRFVLKFDDVAHGPDAVAGTFLALIIITSMIADKYGLSYVVVALALGALLADSLEERPWITDRLRSISETLLEPLFFLTIAAGFAPSAYALLGLLPVVAKFAAAFALYRDPKLALASLAKGGADSALLMASDVPSGPYSAVLTSIALGALLSGLASRPPRSPLKLCELPLDKDYVDAREKVKDVVRRVKGPVPVLDSGRPVGWLAPLDLIYAPPEAEVRDVMREGVPTFPCSAPLWKVLNVDEPLVVAYDGEYRGYLNLASPPKGGSSASVKGND